ncbi:sugar ABC transporter ATP-binding protein [Paenibacillus lentus]|uniref:Autoinducer 2 import ATP-binding protein LsrA n=1 Tax=Paenibacillus lentus TaxID=1338368 RepID=A0A3S8S1I6_9BACL|nr:sugar ABC transporter ATP-binding protein [Paenibacillus lentus]AZK49046.1 sugar ABC transporter ATP-binding protein [Paenibacillus lentus]
MKGITKSFAGVPALRGVDFSLRSGQVHALLGANGAGKSTLMKIVSGAYEYDEGTMLFKGQAVRHKSPADAKKQGIHCVYQEVDASLVPQLSVAENVMLDAIGAADSKVWLSPGRQAREAEQILASLQVNIPVKKKVADLSIAEKQMVLLARIVRQEAKVIIFDEPTAPLSGAEADTFFRILSELKHRGTACVFITHRLPEVMEHADYVTVMRDGRNVHSGTVDELSMEGLVTQMLGKTFAEEFPKIPAEIGEVILSINGLKQGRKIKGIDLTVCRGQIVAVVGLVGAGKTEITRILAGAERPDGGEIYMQGELKRFKQPADAIRGGIVSVPEERRRQGIVIQESVERNISLPLLDRISRFSFISRRQEQGLAERTISALGIKTASSKLPVKYLSGGNQQKVAIGKWVEKEADIFLFDEPTKGVDIGAKSDIFRIIGQLAAAGKGIMYLTSELDEGLGIGDIIVVLYDGSIAAVLPRNEATLEKIMYFASGGQEENL